MKASLWVAVAWCLFIGTVHGRSITSLEAPRGCEWRKDGEDGEKTLTCRVTTIASVPWLIGNLSAIQVDSIVSLGLECSDVLFFENQLDGQHGLFAPLKRLEKLRVEYCKIRYLPGGVFATAHNLRSLVLRTHTGDWSAMTLELHRDSLRGLTSLQHLDLAENNLWSLPPELLCPLQSLSSLNLTRNKLQDVVSLGFSDWVETCTPNLEQRA
ncbi:hypothetical protein KM043_017792 [Ampulex compressa]|nr:hypothetical protein KM043_017792 [Ampulex compressa]